MSLRVLPFLALFPLAGAALAADKEIPTERDEAAEDAADAVEFVLPADAPRPPATMIKKTQSTELGTNPAKTPITKLEDGVYQLQKPYASIWSYLETAEGGRVAPPSQAVRDQVAALRPLLAEVRAANPSWHRLPEYEEHVAFFEHVLATRIAYSEGHTAAREAAAADAVAAVDAAWAAKRADDEGLTHAFHEAHVGEVVLAAAAIGAGDTSVTPLARTTVDAPLFARAYLAESGWNSMHTAGVDCGADPSPAFSYGLFARVGGDLWEIDWLQVDEATFRRATTVDISQGSLTAGGTYDGDDEKTAAFRWLSNFAPRLPDGDSTVEIEVRAWCAGARDQSGVAVAKGTLTIASDAATREALAKRGAFTMGASVHASGALAGIRDKLVRHYAGRGGDLLDLRTASEWAPVRHPATGVILYREASAVALVRASGTTRCELHSITLQEPYDGSSYGPSLDLGLDVARPFVCNLR